jgi:hypothetical protein
MTIGEGGTALAFWGGRSVFSLTALAETSS